MSENNALDFTTYGNCTFCLLSQYPACSASPSFQLCPGSKDLLLLLSARCSWRSPVIIEYPKFSDSEYQKYQGVKNFT